MAQTDRSANQTTALAALPTAPIANLGELRTAMQKISEQANLVSPFAMLDYVPQMHRVSFRPVLIDHTIRELKRGSYTQYTGTDCYFDPKFCERNERALSKTGILKLLRAAGISLVRSERTDDRSDPLFYEWSVSIEIPELDGGRSRQVATKTIDLRPASPQREAMSDKQAAQAVKVMQEVGETKALLRAARAALQLRQKYTVEELDRPFVIPVLVPDLDTSDPEIRKMVARKALGLTEELYGPRPVADAEADVVDITERPPLTDRDEPASTAPDVDDFPDIDTPTDPRCECPCGHHQTITQQVAEITAQKAGSPRCKACYPGRGFDYAAHSSLGDLGIPGNNGEAMTPAEARDYGKKS